MRFTGIISALILMYLLQSCQGDPLLIDTPEKDTVKLLHRYIILDTTRTAPQDTIMVKRIVYGRDLRRVELIVGKEFNATDSLYSIENRYYLYDTDENAQRRTIHYYNPTFTVRNDSTFQYFRYDASNRLVYDSQRIFFQQIISTRIYETSFSGSNVLSWMHRSRRKDTVYSVRSEQTVVNENVTQAVTNIRDSAGGRASYTADFTYDDQLNPLHRIETGLQQFTDPSYFFNAGLLPMNYQMQNNNYVSATISGSSFPEYKYEYRYDSSGYPIFAKFTDVDKIYTTDGKGLKVIFQYY